MVWLADAAQKIPRALCHQHPVQGEGYIRICLLGFTSLLDRHMKNLCQISMDIVVVTFEVFMLVYKLKARLLSCNLVMSSINC